MRGQVLAVTDHYIVAPNLCRIGLGLRNLARPALPKPLIAAAMLLVTPVLARDAVQPAEAPTRPGAAVGSNMAVTGRYCFAYPIAPRMALQQHHLHLRISDLCISVFIACFDREYGLGKQRAGCLALGGVLALAGVWMLARGGRKAMRCISPRTAMPWNSSFLTWSATRSQPWRSRSYKFNRLFPLDGR